MLKDHWLIPDKPLASYDDYRAATGASAVEAACQHTPSDIVRAIQSSGLRGRGGAGFPTGTKWASIANHSCATRFVVCNAAEGEPGTFKDRWLIRHNPYAVLEGMLIAAQVVAAQKTLYIGIKRAFTQEITRLKSAIEELRAAGILGTYEIKIVEGPDEYLFGEEKALLEVIEGGLPLPREAHYPPYEKGLRATVISPNPALVNNAQTFAHIPSIIRLGAESFRQLGTAGTPGTIIFTVSGDVQRLGVYELEAGITLRQLLFDVAGGPKPGRTLKAILSGVAASVITANKLDTPCEFDTMKLIGSGLGSAGFMVYDDTVSIPHLAQGVARFLYVESCNQCTACKHGLRMAHDSLTEMFDSETASDDDYLSALYGARSAPQGNRCYLPVQGSLLIGSLLETFELEFAQQLARPERDIPEILITKITDFDPERGVFTWDEKQARKNPDWTYESESRPPRERSPKRPIDVNRAPVAVRIETDLLEPLRDTADFSGQTVDALVNQILREWADRKT